MPSVVGAGPGFRSQAGAPCGSGSFKPTQAAAVAPLLAGGTLMPAIELVVDDVACGFDDEPHAAAVTTSAHMPIKIATRCTEFLLSFGYLPTFVGATRKKSGSSGGMPAPAGGFEP